MSPLLDYPHDAKAIHHISSTRPIAKKEYTCQCCNKPILKGQKHFKFVYKVGKDDKIRWERSHLHCGE